MRLKAFACSLVLLWGAAAFGQTRNGVFYNSLWDGTPELRAADTPSLLDAGFDLFASQIRSQAATDPNSVDAKWLDSLKAAGAKAILLPNTLQPDQIKVVATKWPDTVIGWLLQDDANQKTPAEVAALLAATQPTVGTLPAMISVGKNANHAQYGGIAPIYHCQTYLGRAVKIGEPLKPYAYDKTLQARAACTGKLLGSMYLSRVPTPYGQRNVPFYRAQEYLSPSQQEAIGWLQLIAGADWLLSYTAYEIGLANPLFESRLAERPDLLEAYKGINARIKAQDSFLTGPGVVETRTVNAAGTVISGTWTKPTGESLTVTVDLTSEFAPQTSIVVKPAPPPPVAGSFRFSVEAGKIKATELP